VENSVIERVTDTSVINSVRIGEKEFRTPPFDDGYREFREMQDVKTMSGFPVR
jgi:hypothetical protein